MQLSFEIPDGEIERVANAFCGMAGHSPCHTPECLLEQVGKIVVARVTAHERLLASRTAEAGVPPLVLAPAIVS